MFNKKIVTLLLLSIFLVNGPLGATDTIGPNTGSQKEEIVSSTIDKRAQILQAYLTKYNSPLQYQAQNFVDAADKYNLDWKLVAAISGVESTFGKHVPGGSGTPYSSYNGWGWGVYGTQAIYFKSWKEGIYTVSEGLRTNYLNKGLTNPYAINRVYAASPTWGAKVSHFLADMEKFEKQYTKSSDKDKAPTLIFKTAGNSAALALN
ncbi:MAG: hypothetical protein UU73_C0003G0255 [Candidatus Daviesbacteria bacterium GW2011_GWA1_41_61]|uniref:Mannosyl-glycoprotein endo-beta-N-acetylglucosamidase-like domain-containing protein n=1 Tax=Candidatus Daviesbacteria bacterium GW2011_GWA2_40_9 TaxID=1618424 RepID=A0A0G0U953_9BACT|nr:MAG: seg [Candidatus Daviesbacteria bacterium GW2011_GWC1_40_9]KKR83786.1 MAG: hypothetical protein UU29_C0001G0006 [Candidatus Daviesbacteria bacterium GW2011_GWA2_40_9]KKR93395.1 MAG: hypothetical protein UU44_C0002G0056 [Candidatus Daviesbacteria bacterium GW2011_GWB1_41_15]KKS15056.1 MAG: hypothetical protein UU73_C0003G0255 [Candidatus Daviesbacteria bacterium GW2011_GWA1_41_61]